MLEQRREDAMSFFCSRKCTSGAWEHSTGCLVWSNQANNMSLLFIPVLTLGVAAAERLPRLDEKLLALQVLLAQLQKKH